MFANDSHIFSVAAVVTSEACMAALSDALFIANTMDIVQPNLTRNTVAIIESAALSA